MIYLTPCVTVRRSFACVTTNDAGDCATNQSAMLMTNRSRGMNTALSRWLPTLLPLYTTTRFQSWITSDIVILVIIAILVIFS